jgi:hypothetical protein
VSLLKISPLKEDKLRRLVATRLLSKEDNLLIVIGGKFGGYFD